MECINFDVCKSSRFRLSIIIFWHSCHHDLCTTGKKLYVAIALFFFSLSSYISYLLFAHVQTRVAIWLHPWDDPMGSAYQIVQSLFAFGYGGVFGTGYTSGFPRLIPEVLY